MPKIIDASVKSQIIQMAREGKGRNEIAESMKGYASSGTVSNVLKQYREEPESFKESDIRVTTPSDREFKKNPDISITNIIEENGHPVDMAGRPLSWWFTNGSEGTVNTISEFNRQTEDDLKSIDEKLEGGGNNSLDTPASSIDMGYPTSTSGVGQPITTTTSKTVPKKVYPRNPIEDRFFELDRKSWEYYGHAQTRILNQIKQEKDRRRHELFLIDSRKSKLEEWRKKLDERESNIKDREARIRSFEPYLLLAKKLCEMKLTLGDALYWTQTINEVAQTKKMDIKSATVYVAQELRQYRQLGGLEKKIERANQELALINMAAIKKQEALTVVEDLINEGVTQSQILQLINFSTEWHLQQPNNLQPNGSSNPGPGSSSIPDNNVNDRNSGFSINDWIRLNLLKGSTANMLNKMGIN